MSEPDEALLWARERTATWAEERGRSELALSIRRGERDWTLTDDAEAYRAGQAASAERIKTLEARIAMLEGRIQSRDWAMLGMIAALRNELPDSAKQHNIEVAIQVLKEADQ